MSALALSRRGTIRGRLTLGFTALIALLLVAGVLARRTMTQMSATIDVTLKGVQEEARLSAELSSDVAQTIEAANAYVQTRDTTATSNRIEATRNSCPSRSSKLVTSAPPMR